MRRTGAIHWPALLAVAGLIAGIVAAVKATTAAHLTTAQAYELSMPQSAAAITWAVTAIALLAVAAGMWRAKRAGLRATPGEDPET